MKKYKEYKGEFVKIMICSKCNTKCKHCYINYNGDFKPDELLDLVKTLKKKYKVRLNGTEPLMNEDYLKSFKISDEELVLTNGLIFKNNLDLVDKIINSGIKRICISYHFSLHNQISTVKKDYLEELISKIREKGIDVELMCTVSKINYDKIFEFCEKTIELKANYIYFIEYMDVAKNKLNKNEYTLNKEERKVFFELLNKARKKYDKKTLMVTRCGNFNRDSYKYDKNFNCPAYNNLVVMTPDYKIYPCNFMISKENEIGFYKDGIIYVLDDYCSCSNECLYCKKNMI